MLKSFRIGGIHPPENKLSRGAAIAEMPLPATVVIPLSQHIGAPATPVVEKGATVKTGQLIAQSGGFVSANIHSPVSGTVTSVDAVPDGGGMRRGAITIKVEGDEWDESIDRSRDLIRGCELTPQEIIAKVAAAGIVGMGGATFPTQVKLSVPPGKTAEYLIINAVECEPYLTADHRVMLERTEELLVGISILAKALGVKKSFVGVENNKPDAIATLKTALKDNPAIEVVALKVQYPQGGEKQLIDSVLRRQVPSGGLPIDVGVVVQNVGTALAVYEAVQKNKPLIERVVTVTGKSLEKPSNLLVRLGTPIDSLIQHCGGMPASVRKVVNGGPMMGRSMANVGAPVTKGTSGVLLLDEKEALREEEQNCIKCGKCISVCPMALEPYLLSRMAKLQRFAELEPLSVTDCIECGCCAYTCPSALPLLDYVRLGKAEVMKIVRSRKA